MTAKFAIVPAQAWRDLRWDDAMKLLSDLTAAGTDPEKVTAILHRIDQFNAINALVTFEDR